MTTPFPKFWKGEQQNYDDLLGTPDRSFVFCLSERSAKMLLAFTDPLHWKTRYFSETGEEIVVDTIDRWASQVEEELVSGLNAMCGCVPVGALSRVSAEGILEISYDGGTTWSPAPYLDPRETSIQFPPLPDDITNTACAGAMNARDQLESFIDQVADILDAGGTFTALVGAVFAIVAVYLSGGALAPLLVPLMGAFVSAGASSVRAAFDETALDAFMCCVKSTIESDAHYDDVAALLECIASDMTGLAGTLTYAIVQLHGAVGMTNWARTGTADGEGCGACGECDDCTGGTSDTWSYQSTLPEGWTYVAGGTGNWDGNPMYLSATPYLDCIIFDQELCVLEVDVSTNTLGTDGVIIHAGSEESPLYGSGTNNWTLTSPQKTDRICFENTTGVAGGVSLNSFTLHWCVPA